MLPLNNTENMHIRQVEQLEAVLLSMGDGVLAVDVDQNILIINQAAARLFDIDILTCVGHRLDDLITTPEIISCVNETLEKQQPIQTDLYGHDPLPQFLQINTAVLRDSQGNCLGAVMVLYDVTRLRRLETIRRDFVANVSHELKTPITSIKGFIETLLDGAMHNEEDLRRFLEIIKKHSDRLVTIIEDLLTLSRIEQGSDLQKIDLNQEDLKDVINAAIHLCQEKADQKSIQIKYYKQSPTPIKINARLIEQALVNLIDNAIKYSDPGAEIDITVHKHELETIISVKDQGCGIASEHLDRLFERFYRVDKARSRKLGGTGLGLAIVKHIAQAHGGSVSIRSVINEGSEFSLHLP